MATDSWKGNSDNWTTAADWSTGAPPTAADTADIETGNPQITSNVGTVASVYMNSTTLSIENGSLNVAQGVTDLSGNLNVDDRAGTFSGNTFVPAAGGSNLSIGGTLTNSGALNIGNVGLSSTTTVSAGAISNLGSISITGASPGTSSPQASLVVAGAAGLGTAGSVSNSVSLFDNANLQFGGGGFTTIASGGSLFLDGTQANVGIAGSNAHNSALSNLSEVDGSLSLLGGNSLTSSATTFTNKSVVIVDNNAQLSLTGVLNNNAFLDLSGGAVTALALNNNSGPSGVGNVNFSSSFNAPGAASVLTLNGGKSSISGNISGTGNLDFEGGTAVVNSNATLKSSNVTLGGNAHVEVAASAANVTSPFSFANGAQATLQLDASVLPATGGTLSNTIVRFAAGDALDLRSLAFTSGATTAYDANSGTLSVTSNGVTDTLSMALPQTTSFQAVSDGSGGTEVVCFCSGTRIRAATGDTAVEDLKIGDLVVTSSGARRPIRWLGHRTIDGRRHPRPHEVLPVRIAAHAFGPQRPARDLLLSPGHSVCVDAVGEVLIPAAALVNGTTIRQEPVERVTYWHVELESHDVILAENLPCESYLDMGNRGFFAEAGVPALHASPDISAADHADFCRPFHQDGPVVAFVRERLAARAPDLGWRLDHAPFADLHLLADGRRVEPETRGLSARFLLPADAEEVWLVSETGVPAEIGVARDLRALGVCVGGLAVDDGFGSPRAVSADHSLLCAGFHELEDGPQRWTAGRARLPRELWAECRGDVFLRVDLTRPALPRWVAPVAAADAAEPLALVG